MPKVELIYDDQCPNVTLARDNLRAALLTLSLAPEWLEHRTTDPDAPEHVRGHGSPTILVDGEDVARGEVEGGDCCRVYVRKGVVGRAPDVDLIAAALLKGPRKRA